MINQTVNNLLNEKISVNEHYNLLQNFKCQGDFD